MNRNVELKKLNPLGGFKLLTYNRCLLALVSCSALNIFIIPWRAFCCPTRLWSVSEKLSLYSMLLLIKYTCTDLQWGATTYAHTAHKGTETRGTWVISSFQCLRRKFRIFLNFSNFSNKAFIQTVSAKGEGPSTLPFHATFRVRAQASPGMFSSSFCCALRFVSWLCSSLGIVFGGAKFPPGHKASRRAPM